MRAFVRLLTWYRTLKGIKTAQFNEKKNRKELLLTETKDILDRIMNAASHHSENPLHRVELKNAITKMIELKEHLKNG